VRLPPVLGAGVEEAEGAETEAETEVAGILLQQQP
jgi:hypothetical protein